MLDDSLLVKSVYLWKLWTVDSLKFEDEIIIEEYCWLTWILVGWLNWVDIFYIPAISLEKWGRTKTASLDIFGTVSSSEL